MKIKLRSISIVIPILIIILFTGCKKTENNNESHTVRIERLSTPQPIIDHSSGNIINGGLCASEGDWLYYSSVKGQLCKMKKNDINQKSMLTGYSVKNINVSKEHIFFTSDSDGKICRINQSGNDKIYLTEVACNYVILYKEEIYYTTAEDNNIYRMKTDAREKMLLYNGNVSYLGVGKEGIFFTDKDKSNNLFRMNRDGTDMKLLSDDYCSCINVYEGYIYYINHSAGGKIYRMKTDGTDKRKYGDASVYKLNVTDGFIYYAEQASKHLYRSRHDDQIPDGQDNKIPDSQEDETLDRQGDKILDYQDDLEILINKECQEFSVAGGYLVYRPKDSQDQGNNTGIFDTVLLTNKGTEVF